jgi:hypothetical protein
MMLAWPAVTRDPALSTALNAVRLPLRGWLEQHRGPRLIVWANRKNQLRALELFSGASGLPPLHRRSLVQYRRAERQLAFDQAAGIVEVKLTRVAGFAALKSISKRPADPEIGVGFEYIGQLRIHLPDALISLSTRASAWERADAREEAIAAHFEPRVRALRFDPYDLQFDTAALNHLADRARFDALFPNHPLTLVRRDLRLLVRETRVLNQKESL